MQFIKYISGKVASIASGDFHSFALLESGEVYSWGRNSYGELGDGTTNNFCFHPQLIKKIPGKVVAIAAGFENSLALLEKGKVYAWGENSKGQLGGGTFRNRAYPLIINGLPGKVVALAARSSHSLALLEKGNVYGWGLNSYGQSGAGTNQKKSSTIN